jgi:hypothetical protein
MSYTMNVVLFGLIEAEHLHRAQHLGVVLDVVDTRY